MHADDGGNMINTEQGGPYLEGKLVWSLLNQREYDIMFSLDKKNRDNGITIA